MSAWVKGLLLGLLLGIPAVAQEGLVVRSVDTPQGLRKLWLPLSQPARPGRPALLVLHGSASSPAQIERVSGFSQLAQQENFSVFYPEGVDGRWNDGRRDPFPPPGPQNDVAFLASCLDLVVPEYKVDPRKLFVVGYDSGGSLALAAGLQLPGRLAGVGSCSGGLSASWESLLAQPGPTSLVVVQSQADPCLPYGGGEVRYFKGRSRGQVLGSDRLLQAWSGLSAPTASSDQPWGARESWGPRCLRYRLTGAGHLWPGTEAPVSEQLFGPLCRELSATSAIWEFFRSLP